MDLAGAIEAIRRRMAALFEDTPSAGSDRWIEPGEIEEQLEGHKSGLFLGVYSEEIAARALEARGVLAALRRRTGADVRVRVDGEEGILRIYRAGPPAGGAEEPGALLVEVKARLERGGAPPPGRPEGFPRVDLLVIDWILLQDPGRPFPPGRRALPGQRHPGLGLGREVLASIVAAARRLEAKGVVAVPQYYHAAVLYHRSFAFIDPVEEGRFQALARDLAGLSFEEAAFAVHEGRVRDATFDRPLAWRGTEMTMPLCDEIRGYLSSAAYIDAAARTFFGTRFEVRAP